MNLYELLGVQQTASAEEITDAYTKEAAKWDTDTNYSDEEKERISKITEAYNILTDADKRKTYDDLLKISSTEAEKAGKTSVGRVLLTIVVVILLLFKGLRLLKIINGNNDRKNNNYGYNYDYNTSIPEINMQETEVVNTVTNRNLNKLYLFDVDSFAKKIKIKPRTKNKTKIYKTPIIIYQKNSKSMGVNYDVADFLKQWIVAPVRRDSINTIVIFEHVGNESGTENNTKVWFIDGRTFALLNDTTIANNQISDSKIKWYIQNSF
jgi:hypothetical protein